QRGFGLERGPIGGMLEGQAICVECLAMKRDRTEHLRAVDIPPFADERMSAKPRLDPNLIALPGHETHFDERRAAEAFEHAVLADRFLAARIARMRFLLYEGLVVPDELIAPC